MKGNNYEVKDCNKFNYTGSGSING
jgi:hypothetical protein